MCKKCNYKVQELLKTIISDDPDKCFIQRGLNSGNPIVQSLARAAARAAGSDMGIDEFVNRIYESLKNNDMEASRKAAYREFLVMVPGFDDIDEESEKYAKEVYGGLL